MGEINVLSLFDGISCGQLALIRAGFKNFVYYASEIDKNSINVTQHHFPNTIQLGDVRNVNASLLPKIDLLIGGSPCQGFSFSGKQLNFEDERSKLFFEFERILKEVKPKYFLLENVSMKKEYEEVITKCLGVEPIVINSSLVSAQNRVRLYWTNMPNIAQPEDRGIKLSDIIETDDETNPAAIRGRRLNKATIIGRRINSKGKREDYNKDLDIIQFLEVRRSNTDKSNCLTTVEKDNVLTSLEPGRYPNAFKEKLPFRYYTVKEYCRLQTVPEDYFSGVVSDSKAKKMMGNGWTVDVISHILSSINKKQTC